MVKKCDLAAVKSSYCLRAFCFATLLYGWWRSCFSVPLYIIAVSNYYYW